LSNRKLILVFSLITVFFLFSGIILDSAYAKKSSGTSNPVVSSSMVCGDTLCNAPLTVEQKIGYYLLDFIEIDESSVIQQSMFSVGEVTIQGLGSSFSSGMTVDNMPRDSILERGIANSFAVPIENLTPEITGVPSRDSMKVPQGKVEPTVKHPTKDSMQRITPQADPRQTTTPYNQIFVRDVLLLVLLCLVVLS